MLRSTERIHRRKHPSGLYILTLKAITLEMFKKLKKIPAGLIKLLTISAFVSAIFICLLNLKSTAVTWPSSDNLPGVCRLLDAACLTNDFFTSASSGTSPRLPYVYFLSIITQIVDNGIGGGLALVKAFLLAFLPIAVSLFFFASVKTHTERKGEEQWVASPENIMAAVCAPLFVFLLQGKIGALLSVAWWMPLYFDASAHNVSLLLTISGFLILWLGGKSLGAAVVFLGAVAHPVVGLFSSVFSCILLCKFDSLRKDFRFVGIGFGASLVGAVFIKIFFEAGGVMSAQDFVRIYVVEAHPAHYIPSQFGSLSKMPWMGSFAIVMAGLLSATIILFKLNSAAWKNSFLAFLAYSSAVIAQFLFVEISQIKLIATLGPSRFTMFGAWFVFIFYTIAFLKFFEGNLFLLKISDRIRLEISSVRWIYICACYFFLGAVIAFYSFKSSSFDLPDEAMPLATFARTKTDISDVFVLPFYAPRVDFPLKTGRAIFHGNGFPFSENNFKEWDARNSFVNGNNAEIVKLPGSWIGDKYANHYRSLAPSDFLGESIKYKIDWVVLETDYSEKFSGCKADFDSPKYKAYSLVALKLCAR